MNNINKEIWDNAKNEVQQLINDLRNTSSSKEKIAILENVTKSNNHDLINTVETLFKLTYSPREIFYIKPIKDFKPIDNQFNQDIQDLNVFDILTMFKSYIRGNKALNLYHDFKNNCISKQNEFESELLDLVLNKDLKAGIAANTINKVFPKLIPQQPYMRCSLVKQITSPEQWLSDNTVIYSQEKMDGMFINFTINEDKSIEISSRAGTIFPQNEAFDTLNETAQYLENARQYHGELLVVDKNTKEYLPREIGNGILNSIAKEGKKGSQFNKDEHELQFVIWDSISLEQLNDIDNQNNIPYSERFAIIENSINNLSQYTNSNAIKLVDTHIYHNVDDATEDFRKRLLEGKEGVCWKLNSMLWEDGTSKGIIKLKNVFEVDLKIVDFIEGNGKNEKYFGSIRTQSEDGKLIVDVSGFTDDMRKEISDNREQYLGKIMAVKASYITQTNDNTYSLFLPRFAEIREDKTIADTFERIKEQYGESLTQYNPAQELRDKLEEKLAKKNKKKIVKTDNDNLETEKQNTKKMKI